MASSFETHRCAMLLRTRSQTLMVRSAPSRVSNDEASGGATMIRVNRSPSGGVVVVAVQVREQEYQWQRQRPDDGSNPSPNFKTASPAFGNSTGQIDRSDRRRHQQGEGQIVAHSAGSDAASVKPSWNW